MGHQYQELLTANEKYGELGIIKKNVAFYSGYNVPFFLEIYKRGL